MNYIKISLLLILTLINTSKALSSWPFRSSFVINCWVPGKPYHLMPLNFFEFRDEVQDMTLKPDYVNNLIKLAPKTFKNYKKNFPRLKRELFPMDYADYERYDSLVKPPPGCGVITMIQEGVENPNLMLLDRDTWNTVPKETQDFLLFDYYVQFYLKAGLSHSDYRMFSLYIATGAISKFSDKQRIEFLGHYGINE